MMQVLRFLVVGAVEAAWFVLNLRIIHGTAVFFAIQI